MRLYIAATAPGNETESGVGKVRVDRRLYSFYFLQSNVMMTRESYNHTIKRNQNEDKKRATSKGPGKS